MDHIARPLPLKANLQSRDYLGECSNEPMGISDWYISSYLTIIILTQIGALVILVGVWLKMKKYDSDRELDSLAGTVLNPSSIYKPLY
ncbi:hypothetical protein quinque_005111 [Culex quinquefasciatus]